MNGVLYKSLYLAQSIRCAKLIKRYNAKGEKKFISSSNIGAFYRFISRKLHSVAFVAPLVNSMNEISFCGF